MIFQAFRGSSGAQIAFTILLATSIGNRVTQCTAHERGVANAVRLVKIIFLENKVVINFNFRHGAKKLKEWVKPLYIGYHQALELPKNLFPFPRTGHLKISLGPTQFLYSKFHGLLKLIFHTNQYNGA